MKKSVIAKEEELNHASQLLQEMIPKLVGDDKKYLIPISAQLRALICHGTRSLNPLLLKLAEEKFVNLECYGMKFVNDTGLVFQIIPQPLFIENPNIPFFVKFTFKDWLDEPYLVYAGYTYTPNEVIRLVAEKEGGAHYDDDIPDKLLKLKGIIHHKSNLQAFNAIENLVIQLSIVVIKYIAIVIEKDV